jgi:hypothetical protein
MVVVHDREHALGAVAERAYAAPFYLFVLGIVQPITEYDRRI